jgi:hypothetical protein
LGHVSSTTRVRALVMVLVAWLALAAAVAQAAPDRAWSSPITVPGTAGVDLADLTDAVDSGGDVLVAWRQELGGGERGVVRAAFRSPGHAFVAPVRLSSPRDDASDVSVAFDRFGDAIVVWLQRGASSRVRAAIRSHGGRFGRPFTLSRRGGAGPPTLAFDGAGDAFVVWNVNGRHLHGVQLAIRPRGRQFGAPLTVSGGAGGAGPPRLAVDARGDALMVWRQCSNTLASCDGNGRPVLHAAWRPADGSVKAPVALSGDEVFPLIPAVAIGPTGNAVVVWQDQSTVEFSVATVGGAFSAPATLAANAGDPVIAMDGTGNAIAAWVLLDPEAADENANQRLQAAVLTAGATAFGTAQDVTADGSIGFPALAMSPRGDAVLTWNPGPIVAATGSPGQPFGPAENVAPPAAAFGATLAIAPSGEAAAVWGQEIKKTPRVKLATYRFGG